VLSNNLILQSSELLWVVSTDEVDLGTLVLLYLPNMSSQASVSAATAAGEWLELAGKYYMLTGKLAVELLDHYI